jgi:tRNA G10  N-methylase Trm11
MDARNMSLLDSSVDVIICDIPFGNNEFYLPAPPSSSTSSTSPSTRIQELYWSIFLEFYRVLRKANGRVVILTDQVRKRGKEKRERVTEREEKEKRERERRKKKKKKKKKEEEEEETSLRNK